MNRSIDDYLHLAYILEIVLDNGAWFVQTKELEGCMNEVNEWDDSLPMIHDAKRS